MRNINADSEDCAIVQMKSVSDNGKEDPYGYENEGDHSAAHSNLGGAAGRTIRSRAVGRIHGLIGSRILLRSVRSSEIGIYDDRFIRIQSSDLEVRKVFAGVCDTDCGLESASGSV